MTNNLSDYQKPYLDLGAKLPERFRTKTMTSLMNNLFNRFLTKDESSHVIGWVGDKMGAQSYLEHADADRTLNALQPVFYLEYGSTQVVTTWSEILRKLEMLGVNVYDFDRWGKTVSYNFAPPIDIDKFCNFSKYRWYGHLVAGSVMSWNPKKIPEYYVMKKGYQTNDWTGTNYWAHEDDVTGLGYDVSDTVQATRPILEYDADLELNALFDSATGLPAITSSSTTAAYTQQKTELNQKPMFNIYRMGALSSGKVSPIIYFDEDSSAPVDSELQFRAVINTFSDYMFRIGITDDDGHLYLYKKLNGGKYETIWKTGTDTSAQTYFVPEFYAPDSSGELAKSTPTDTSADSEGTWKTPDPIFYNTEHEVRKLISYGDLYAHFMTIIKAQPGLNGNPYGTNNLRNIPQYMGMGGTIKDFKGNLGIFIGLMSQEDITPVTIMKFAEYQYANVINAVNEYVTQGIADYIVDTGIEFAGVLSNTLDPAYDVLHEKFRDSLATRNDYNVFIDSTSGIVGWPSTLPRFGMWMPTVPAIEFDMKLGYNVIKHHDGHITRVETDSPELMANIAAEPRLRSNGQKTQGSIGTELPIMPFKNQFWYDPVARLLKSFDVISDESVTPTSAKAGDFWYARNSDTLYQFDGATWNNRPQEMAWKKISIANISASLLLSLERRLYRYVAFLNQFGSSILKWDSSVYETTMAEEYKALLENQFAQFGTKYNVDPYGTDFLSADAFTWNYKNAIIQGVTAGTARWYDIYEQYYGTVRPNLEPWKLQGYQTKPSWWDENYAGTATPTPGLDYSTGLYIQELPATTWDITHNYGYRPIVRVFDEDGYQMWPNDIIHLTDNRVQIKFTAARTGVAKLLITLEASEGQGIGRMWSDQMWYDIRHDTTPDHPAPTGPWTKPFSVNTETDELLPPYVSPSSAWASEALLNAIPAGVSDRYEFGENGPIELIWRKSIEFAYDNVITSFLLDPIKFVEKTWGHNPTDMTTNGYDIDRTYHRKDSHKNMVVHGELLTTATFFEGEQAVKILQNTFDSTFFDVTYLYTLPTTTFSGIMVLRKNSQVVAYSMGSTLTYVEGSKALVLQFTDGAHDWPVGTKVEIAGTHTTFITPTTKNMLGLCQWYVNLNRYNSVDTTISLNNSLLRRWEARLGYRVGGLLDTEALEMRSDSFELIRADHTFVIKNNKFVSDSWLDAIRVQVAQTGAMKIGTNGLSSPDYEGQDWIFKVQTFNPRHPILQYYDLDTAGPYTTFMAFDGQNVSDGFKKYTAKGELKTVPTPFVVRGIQNLVNFIYGYVAKLEEDGWQFSSFDDSRTDPTTGRYIDWQFYIEKFINALYTGSKAGDALLMNPFGRSVWFNTPTGVVSGLSNKQFIDGQTSQYVYDILGRSIRTEKIRVLREDLQTKFISDVPMAGMHLLVDKYEHVVVFDDYSGDKTSSRLLYDGFLGLRTARLYMDIIRQSEFTGRLSFGGYYIKGNEVRKNLEQAVKGLQNFYDFDNMYYGSDSQNAATGLLGFTRKDYMDDLDVPVKSQLGFWKGLISNKGSNFSLDAFLNSARFLDAKLDEFWAYKLSDYGDSRILKFPEIKVNVQDADEKAMKLQFLEDGETVQDGFIGIRKDDEDRWFSLDDMKDSRYYFEAEVQGSITYTAVVAGKLYDLVDANGKEFLPDAVDVYLASDENKVPLTTGVDYDHVNATTIRFRTSLDGKTVVVRCYGPASPEFNPAKLINYQDKTIAADIQLWDPARGSHAYVAASNVDMIADSDPARYNYSTKIVANRSYDPMRAWDEDQVGKVWWKTDNLGYIPYYDRRIFSGIDTRIATWGSIADWASVDVYQWTESEVAPSEYESQSGVTGRASLKDVYYRNRSWLSTPIAWKYSDFPESAPRHFTASGEARIKLTSHELGTATAILSENSWTTFGLGVGSRFAGMDNTYNQPFGTAEITGTESYLIGSSTDYFSTSMASNAFITGMYVTGSKTSNSLGNVIGPIAFSMEQVGSDYYVRATALLTSLSQAVKVVDTPNVAGAQVSLNFFELGVMAVGSTVYDWTQTGYTTSDQRIAAVAAAFGNTAHDVMIRTAVEVSVIDPFVFGGDPVDELNAIGDGLSTAWVAWTQPTVDDIANDLSAPNNKWEPVYGKSEIVSAGPFIVGQIKAEIANPLTTIDGAEIRKYSYKWDDWTILKDDVREVKYDGTSTFFTNKFTYTTDQLAKRINVYVNGFIVNASDWKIIGNAVTITKTVKLGDKVRVIVRKYAPTPDDLAFDPDLMPAFDDPSKTIQYKEDYQYTVKEVRDENGLVKKTLYYFWVADKTVAEGDKTMAIKNVAQQLKNNTSPFAFFAGMSTLSLDTLPRRYKAFVTVGLNRYVTRDNFYKLRFTNNFILRDDPNEMDLKNKHAEWSLMRRAQLIKIPKQLWDKLTDTVVGSDSFGNAIPSLERRTYDAKHNVNTHFGFGDDQALVDRAQALETIKYTIMNTQLTVEATGDTDYIEFMDLTDIDSYFANSAAIRETMTRIYSEAKGRQVNEIMFNVLEDMLTSNYEMTDIFKTSFIAAYSIRTLNSSIA